MISEQLNGRAAVIAQRGAARQGKVGKRLTCHVISVKVALKQCFKCDFNAGDLPVLVHVA